MDRSCLEDLQENGQIVFCNTHKKQIGVILMMMMMPVMFFPFLLFCISYVHLCSAVSAYCSAVSDTPG